jgi:hypothetical protein
MRNTPAGFLLLFAERRKRGIAAGGLRDAYMVE